MKPRIVRIASFIAATLLALPIQLGIWTGLYLWISPYLFLNSVLATWSITALNGLGLAMLVWIFCKHRGFCRFLCPTGLLCDTVSKYGYKSKNLLSVQSWGKTLCFLALFLAAFGVPLLACMDPMALFYLFLDGVQNPSWSILGWKISGLAVIVSMNIVIPHIWCQRLCPLGGLQDGLTEFRVFIQKGIPKSSWVFNRTRRLVLTGMVGTGCVFILRKVAHIRSMPILRPPGSLPEHSFKAVCIRCGNCSSVCPTEILHSSLDVQDPLGVLTPQVRFEQSYCLPECIRCGSVCPSGAIPPFSLLDKKRLVIGIAHIDIPNCLLSHSKECDRCKFYCAYDAIEIRSTDDFTSFPLVLTERCVGCGACQIVCPVEAIVILPPGYQPLPSRKNAEGDPSIEEGPIG